MKRLCIQPQLFKLCRVAIPVREVAMKFWHSQCSKMLIENPNIYRFLCGQFLVRQALHYVSDRSYNPNVIFLY